MRRLCHVGVTLSFFAAACGLPAADLSSQELRQASWPQHQFDHRRSGYTPSGPKPPFKMLWRLGFGERISYATQPIVAGGTVYVGTKSGSLWAVDGETGEHRRLIGNAGPILHSAAFFKGRIFCCSLDGFVYALDAATGVLAWKFDSGFGISTAPLVMDNMIFAVNREGTMFALEPATGRQLWRNDLGAPCLCAPSGDKGRVFVGTEDMFVHALSAKDGAALWKSDKLYGTSFLDGHPVVHKDRVIVHTLFREGPSHASQQPWDTLFGPWWPSGREKPEVKELLDEIESAGKFPDFLVEEQDKIIAFYRENPEYMNVFVLDAATGEQPYIVPHFRDGGNGLNPLPVEGPDGRLITQFHLHGTGPAFFDVETGRILDMFSAGHLGSNDEPHGFSCSGDILFAFHKEITYQQQSCYFILSERKQVLEPWCVDNLLQAQRAHQKDDPIRVIGWSPYRLKFRDYMSLGCLLKHGCGVAIAGERFYFIREHWLDAFKGVE